MLSCQDILCMGMGPKFHPQIIQIGWGAKISGFPPSSPGCHRQWSSSCWWCLSFYCGSSREQGNHTCLPCPSAEVAGHDARLEELYEVRWVLDHVQEDFWSFLNIMFPSRVGFELDMFVVWPRGQRCVKSTVCALGAPAHEAVSAASSEAQWQPGEAQVRLPKKTFDAIKSWSKRSFSAFYYNYFMFFWVSTSLADWWSPFRMSTSMIWGKHAVGGFNMILSGCRDDANSGSG